MSDALETNAVAWVDATGDIVVVDALRSVVETATVLVIVAAS